MLQNVYFFVVGQKELFSDSLHQKKKKKNK